MGKRRVPGEGSIRTRPSTRGRSGQTAVFYGRVGDTRIAKVDARDVGEVIAECAASLTRDARERDLLVERARECANGPTPPEPQ
jgi:hypothetical protein